MSTATTTLSLNYHQRIVHLEPNGWIQIEIRRCGLSGPRRRASRRDLIAIISDCWDVCVNDVDAGTLIRRLGGVIYWLHPTTYEFIAPSAEITTGQLRAAVRELIERDAQGVYGRINDQGDFIPESPCAP